MAVGLRLDLRQSQQLVMTPQLQQAIKLLQMSHVQLAEFVDQELERNPILRLEGSEGEAPRADASPAQPAATDRRIDDHSLAADTFDTGTENLHDGGPPPTAGHADGAWTPPAGRGGSGSTSSFEDLPNLEERLAERPSLRDHLRSQLGQATAPRDVVAVALYLVEELDEHGLFRSDPDDLATRLGTSVDTVEAALGLLQSCDPTGVGAVDLADCLRLQLAERGQLDDPFSRLLQHLDQLAHGDLRQLRLACGVTEARLAEMLRTLRELDPRPCMVFEVNEPETLVPDILLRRTDWGGWQVELNPDTLPRVLVDQRYAAEIGRSGVEARHFLSECRSNASWLIKSLDQRSRTIVKIASEIVRQQEEFFEHGITGLRPLTLRAIAEEIGMHESTVSRVTANKYMSTDRGIFDLKFFFTNALTRGEGDVAAEAVRHRIKAMVDAEPAKAVMSDDAIVEKLAADGIEIARRTVAKYRKCLNIPSSVERRRTKSISA
ncbi:MAG: RNA polymerase factor sigma-54 [Pseudomonadota bacterium]